jgi:hypothetical protein
MEKVRFIPNPHTVTTYNEMFERYKRLLKIVPQFTKAVALD